MPCRAVESRAAAVGTGLAVEELRQLLAYGARLRLAVAPLENAEDGLTVNGDPVTPLDLPYL